VVATGAEITGASRTSPALVAVGRTASTEAETALASEALATATVNSSWTLAAVMLRETREVSRESAAAKLRISERVLDV
tara:strand:+ start:617 stop:853 length:237 start_codon:yes stop_codon:yes gene_type:complete